MVEVTSLFSLCTARLPNSIVQSFLEECLCAREGTVVSGICELFIEFCRGC